jgi:predicted transcriptional regulator
MAVDKDTLHRMIDNIEDPTKLRLVFDAIYSIVEGRVEHFELDAWQREEIRQALKEADEGDFASTEDVKRIAERWLYEN